MPPKPPGKRSCRRGRLGILPLYGPFFGRKLCDAKQSSHPHAELHVGIIMDGNGRWATRRGLSRLRGHEAGVEAIRRVVEAAPGQGVGTLTLYAFSSDNWRRPKAEVSRADGAAAILSGQRGREPDPQRRPSHRDRPPRSPARTDLPHAIGRAEASDRQRRHAASAHRDRLFRPRCDPQRCGTSRQR